jgi:lantibiotic modifying enzyme
VRAAQVLGEASYRETAEAAGEATFHSGDVRGNPSQCHGLVGNGELFIELYHLTGENKWLQRAADFAQRAFTYRKADEEGVSWGADEEGFYSPDFMCGAAGTGHFFLRLWAPDQLRMPLF